MLNDGVAWLMEQLLALEGEAVTYRRGTTTGSIGMIFSNPSTPQTDTKGITFQHSGADFQCRSADLMLSGAAITPAPGDKIDRTVSGQTQTYEVQPKGDGEQPYTLIAGKFRIHTKLVKVR